jgi:hypothetical protein
MGTEKRIYRLLLLCVSLTALAYVVPRFVPDGGGFASAATAILVLLAMLAAAGLVSLYLLFVTIRVYREIAWLPRVAGIAPSVLLAIALALLGGLLRY